MEAKLILPTGYPRDPEFQGRTGEKLRLHPPVMVEAVLNHLRIGEIKAPRIADLTVGTGGHSFAILSSNPTATLIGLDRDPMSLQVAEERLQPFAGRFHLFQADMGDLVEVLKKVGWASLDACLIDPGVSLWQIDSGRGFSFTDPGLLDMRYDPTQGVTGSDLLQTAPPLLLERVFKETGETPAMARRIVAAIVQKRKEKPVWTGQELAQLVASIKTRRPSHLHPATYTFMALRILVNDEKDALRNGLESALLCLCPGGRVGVLCYQSVEDRIVKSVIREWSSRHPDISIRPAFKKPLFPDPEEVKANPRARSARLRVIERVEREG